ncbi:MAG TPA: hypothetical protein VF126_12800, partial [Acidobacteriaceae bacterium]
LLLAGRRNTARRQQRQPNGRFAALPASSLSVVDRGPGRASSAEAQEHRSPSQPSHAIGSVAEQTEAAAMETLDYGAYPVTTPAREDAPFEIPPIEDAASIQLALIEVAQALAANRIEPKRAGLLLYALQVASTNAKNVNIPSGSAVRSITYTDEGLPLGPQELGWDVEDVEEEIAREEAEAEEDE